MIYRAKNFKIPMWDLNALYDLCAKYQNADWCKKVCGALIMRSEGATYKVIKEKLHVDPSSTANIVDTYINQGIKGVEDHLLRIKKFKIDVEQRNKEHKKIMKEVYGIETLSKNKRYYMLQGNVILITDKLYYDEIEPTKELLAYERGVPIEQITVLET